MNCRDRSNCNVPMVDYIIFDQCKHNGEYCSNLSPDKKHSCLKDHKRKERIKKILERKRKIKFEKWIDTYFNIDLLIRLFMIALCLMYLFKDK